MKYCQYCGTQLDDDAVLCTSCGCYATTNIPERYSETPTYYEGQNFSQSLRLSTNRSLLKFVVLSIITFGIYGIVIMSKLSRDINIIASKYDGRTTMHYCIANLLLLGPTLGIVPLVWYHNLSNRIGVELNRRHINYSFGAGAFWGWCILGSLIIIGPFIYDYKLLKSMNLLCADFNKKG